MIDPADFALIGSAAETFEGNSSFPMQGLNLLPVFEDGEPLPRDYYCVEHIGSFLTSKRTGPKRQTCRPGTRSFVLSLDELAEIRKSLDR